jgi:hypothetical protein
MDDIKGWCRKTIERTTKPMVCESNNSSDAGPGPICTYETYITLYKHLRTV